MAETIRPPVIGDYARLKTRDEEGETHFEGKVRYVSTYNDLSFTAHIEMGDNRFMAMYDRVLDEFIIPGYGDVVRYEFGSK